MWYSKEVGKTCFYYYYYSRLFFSTSAAPSRESYCNLCFPFYIEMVCLSFWCGFFCVFFCVFFLCFVILLVACIQFFIHLFADVFLHASKNHNPFCLRFESKGELCIWAWWLPLQNRLFSISHVTSVAMGQRKSCME